MISKEELKSYAQLKKLNLGQAEKSYFQDIMLFILYEQFGQELVFKGGTALQRAYGLDRFSEDIDFTLTKELPLREVLERGLARFYLEAEIQEAGSALSLNYVLRIRGPLYIGIRNSLCRIELDFSRREQVLLETTMITLGRLLEELPAFEVVVMAKEEILAEKVRAVLTRTKARDVYDVWFLLQAGTKMNFGLLAQKLQYYQKGYRPAELRQHLHLKESIWESELTPLIPRVPPFRQVVREIMAGMK